MALSWLQFVRYCAIAWEVGILADASGILDQDTAPLHELRPGLLHC